MIGQTIKHYKILNKLGQGGMGVVYKAEDTKLNRTIALKFLPTNKLGAGEEKQRFEQEAKAAAQLNHNNIATIYEINEHEGETFIAMEYIEGETISDKVKTRPMKIKDVIKVAKQIAEGLHSAHEQGIVHRDIKSANIMVTKKGVVKIMDFGLAKMSKASMVTKAGTTLGTISYMSPEQSQGEKVDHRSDIWSLGIVFYEMISGQLPFKGEYESAIIYSIMNEEPEPLTALRTGVPMDLEKIVNKLLAKDPDERYQNIVELPVDLKNVSVQETESSKIGSSVITDTISREKKLTVEVKYSYKTILKALALIIPTILLTWMLKPNSTSFSPNPPLPLTASLNFEEDGGPGLWPKSFFSISPDGKKLAYTPTSNFDEGRLRIRNLTDGSTGSLSGTEGAERPFWSPDGSMLGYFADGRLRVVPAKGGPSITLAAAPQPAGGTWNAEDIILYNPTHGPLFQISAMGGNPSQVTQPQYQGEEHRWPAFLPDGRHFLFWTIDFSKDEESTSGIYKGDLLTGKYEKVREGAGDPVYVEPGFLVFRIGYSLPNTVASVFAQRFDPESNTLSGQPFPLLTDLSTPGGDGQLSVTNRTIVFGQWNQDKEQLPILMSRNGEMLDSLMHREGGWVFKFSKNGKRVAIAGAGLWVHDLSRKISERIPTEVSFPIPYAWSPNDSSIVYSAARARGQLKKVTVAGTPKEETIFQSVEGDIEFIECSPDGRTILFGYAADETRKHRELWACDVEKGTASLVLESAFNVFEARFAPNGQWYAYSSNEGLNDSDVYLRPFPGPGAPIRVSAEGGRMPRWRRDGNELFYINDEEQLVVVRVEFAGDRPTLLPAEGIIADSKFWCLDVHPDGQRFLMGPNMDTESPSQFTILRDWQGLLEEKE